MLLFKRLHSLTVLPRQPVNDMHIYIENLTTIFDSIFIKFHKAFSVDNSNGYELVTVVNKKLIIFISTARWIQFTSYYWYFTLTPSNQVFWNLEGVARAKFFFDKA